jgi:hypothetical protein
VIGRILAFPLIAWLLGFIWFAGALPQPAPAGEGTDVIVVLTGGTGRIERGVTLLREGSADRLLVSGVFE